MPARKTVLIFPFNLLSHYLRCLVLVDRYFSGDEYEIFFVNSKAYNKFIEEQGYRTFHCEQFDAGYVIERAEQFKFSWLNEKDIERVLTSQVSAIRSLKADIVIGDASPTLRMAAEITQCRYFSLINGYMTPYYSCGRELSARHPVYNYLKELPEPLYKMVTAFGERLSMKRIHRPFSKIRKKYGLRKVTSYLAELQGDLNMICDLPGLFPQKGLPANYAFTGPLIYHNSHTDNNWLKQLEQRKPVILLAMGSTGNWQKLNFFNEKQFAWFTIIAAGDTERVLYGSHIIRKDFVDLSAVLEISDLMICHGGNGTIYHALLKGVYMLCLTSHFEQEWNVHALERIGYGMSADHFSAEDWLIHINKAKEMKLKPYFAEQSYLIPVMV